MKKMILAGLAVACALIGTAALAVSGVGGVAAQVTGNLSAVARLITAASYVAGMGFAVGAIIKFKAYKDNPTQVPIGQPFVLLAVGAALIFAPTVFTVSGQTLFGSDATTAGPSGIASFGTKYTGS